MGEAYGFGIEEEYFLADRVTGASPCAAAADAFHAAAARSGLPASPELLKGQIEVATEPGVDLAAAAAKLRSLRRSLGRLAEAEGLALFAARAPHPLAVSAAQATTEKKRYQELEGEFGALAHRMMVCATHVHVEVPDPIARVGLMRRILPHLPLLLALSVGSPYWQGQDTKLDGFRLAAFSEWPADGLARARRRRDRIRPSRRTSRRGRHDQGCELFVVVHPPERQVPDARDAHLRFLHARRRCDRNRRTLSLSGARRRARARDHAGSRCDRARCRGRKHLAGAAARRAGRASWAPPRGRRRSAKRSRAALTLVAEDADALGCAAALAPARIIVAGGGGADLQRAAFRAAQVDGADEAEALRAVVRALAEATAR